MHSLLLTATLLLNAVSTSTPSDIKHGHPLATLELTTLPKGALLLPDLGTHHRAVKVRSAEAQTYFDQGLRLLFAFNHDEAARSFARAAQIDPQCALCWWGTSLTLGPNYNVPMLPGRAQAAWDALQKARALAPHTTPVEQALIGALQKRYGGPTPVEPPAQAPFNAAYAEAMRGVAQRFPDDADVQVLFAEALMDVNPWKLWSNDGKPAEGTTEIIATLERVLARAPQHPGANHYYIHALEPSAHPEKAEVSADRLGKLMPGAGHVVHMPAHIYQRVGRYADASEVNRRAVALDLAYMAKTDPPGYYAMYLGHNFGFLAYSASMEGRAAEAVQAARRSAQAVPPEMLEVMPGMDFFASEPLFVGVRFGLWNELLAEPRPPAKYKVLTGLWLHAQGMAHASLGRLPEARADLAALDKLRLEVPKDLQASNNLAQDLLAVASYTVAARIAEKSGKMDEATAEWTNAVAQQDRLSYSEPADWFYPLRHYLGAALLDAKRFKEAEVVYREDLSRNPKNGWSYYGLWQALKAQGKSDAAQAERDFHAAWHRADTELSRTAF